MSNYIEAQSMLLTSAYQGNEVQFLKANALATLALVDEMRAGREAQIEDVFLIVQYRAADNSEHGVLSVFKDRTEAYSERDGLNDWAGRFNDPLRYIIKEKRIK